MMDGYTKVRGRGGTEVYVPLDAAGLAVWRALQALTSPALISERDLAARAGVGRQSVRTALRRLALAGAITVERPPANERLGGTRVTVEAQS